jgi:hypothetical protein
MKTGSHFRYWPGLSGDINSDNFLQVSWQKPYSLGSYDVDADEGWVVMRFCNEAVYCSFNNLLFMWRRDTDGDIYFYCPKTWDMTWEQPHNTVMCEICEQDFAVCRCVNRRLQHERLRFMPAWMFRVYFIGLTSTSRNIVALVSIRESKK